MVPTIRICQLTIYDMQLLHILTYQDTTVT